MKFAKKAPAAIFLVSAFAALSHSTTLVRMDLRELSRSAQLVAHAKCIGAEVRAERGAIWTFETFQVIEMLKGAAGAGEITVRLPGGQIGHVRESVEGVPRFSAGEEVVLFLERNYAGDFGVTGWLQGTFRIHRGATPAVEPSVTQDSSAFAVFDSKTRQFTATGIRNLPLANFRTQIAEALAAPQERK